MRCCKYYILYDNFCSVIIQYYSVKLSPVDETRKATVETTKQLECVTKGHIAMQTILF